MSKQESEKLADGKRTVQGGGRRRFLAGALIGGLLGSLLAGTLSVYAQTFQGFGGWFRAGHGYCRARHVGSQDPAVVGDVRCLPRDGGGTCFEVTLRVPKT